MSSLTALYALHKDGKIPSNDPRWLEISRQLQRIARGVVDSNSRGLFGTPKMLAVEEVGSRLLQKFIGQRLDHTGGSIDPLLSRAAHNDMRSYFRLARSPTAATFDGAEATWRDERPAPRPDGDSDMFARVRAAMSPFRFGEYQHVRDALLSYFLTHLDYPGCGFLHHFSVHHSVRPVVYTAAVFDCNRAMMAICELHEN